jgi:hypothetical protein
MGEGRQLCVNNVAKYLDLKTPRTQNGNTCAQKLDIHWTAGCDYGHSIAHLQRGW